MWFLCDKVCQWLAAGRWFFQGTPVFSTNKTDRYETRSVRFHFNGNASYLPTFTLNAKYIWAVLIKLHVTRSLVWYVCFVDRCLSFCTFSFGHCVVCSSLIYGFWLLLWYLQTLLICYLKFFMDYMKNNKTNTRTKIQSEIVK